MQQPSLCLSLPAAFRLSAVGSREVMLCCRHRHAAVLGSVRSAPVARAPSESPAEPALPRGPLLRKPANGTRASVTTCFQLLNMGLLLGRAAKFGPGRLLLPVWA